MARRNIFDRDTGAGYYSDSLGNFLESIPSLYGQMAKEKRLEKQHIEDTNYRNQAYNDQLMQQAKTNIRNTENDQLTRDKFEYDKRHKAYTNSKDIAELFYKQTGDASRLIQVENEYNPGKISTDDSSRIELITDNRKSFDEDYQDWISLKDNDKYARGNNLKDLISKASQLSKVGDTRNKMHYNSVYTKLQDEFKTFTTNSGKHITDTSLWGATPDLDFYDDYDSDIKKTGDRINSLKEVIDEMAPISYKTEINKKTGEKTLIPNWSVIEKANLDRYKNTIVNLEMEMFKSISSKQRIQDKHKYPVFNLEEEDLVLEGMKSVKSAEEIETENSSSPYENKLPDIESDILSGGDSNEFLKSLDDDESLNDYLFGYESDKKDEVPEQIPDLADVETRDETEQPIVNEIEENIDVSDTIGKTIEDDIAVVENVDDEVPELDQVDGSILNKLPIPIVSAAGGKPPVGVDKSIDDLFLKEEVVKPPTEENIRRRDINEKILKKNDKSYEEGLNKYNEIQNSNIYDTDGNKINLTAIGTFNKQINSMVKRVKDLQMRSLSPSPQAKLKARQNVFEQKQIVKDLLELNDKILDLPTYIYYNKIKKGMETGQIGKVESKRFKQSIKNALKGDKYTKGLPKFLKYEDEINPLISSKSSTNESYDWTNPNDDIINFIKNSKESPYHPRNQSGNNLRNQNIKSVLSG